MPNSTEAIVSLVVVTANVPSRKASAGAGSIVKVKGTRMAMPTSPDRPGTAPNQSPTSTPRKR